MSIFRKIINWLDDAAYVWRQELKHVLRDEGVMLFCVVVPLAYPLLYSWVYNNEVVHEVPVVVVDECRSATSREFLRKSDATPDLKIISYCADMEEARNLMHRHKAYGLIHIPAEFESTLVSGRQRSLIPHSILLLTQDRHPLILRMTMMKAEVIRLHWQQY